MAKKKNKTPFILTVVQWMFPKLERFAPTLAHRYFIKIFFTPLRYKSPEKEKDLARRADRFVIHVDGKKIQVYSWGAGPLVLFVHGWAGRGTQFRKMIEAFIERGYRVASFDGPAHGQSEGKTASLIDFDLTLKRLFEELGQQPEAVITHSFGGAATLYSIVNGLKVKRLINIASPTIADEIINTYLRAINGSWKSGQFFKQYILKTYNKPFEEFSGLHFVRHLPYPLPLLLIYDEDDRDVIMKHAEELLKLYPATLVRTKGLGHTRILKDDFVIETCLRFVASKGV
jgi:hypothetical protein